MEFGEVGSGLTAEALQDGFEEGAEHEKFLREAVAKTEAGAIGKDERGDKDGDDDAEHDFADAMKREQPVRSCFLHQHDDGDGDAGETRAVAQAEESAEDDGEEDGDDVVPGQRAERGERESEGGADERAEDAIARRGDGCAEVGLKDDDGTDGAPVAVVKAEAKGDTPAESSGERGFGGVDEEAFALPREEALIAR